MKYSVFNTIFDSWCSRFLMNAVPAMPPLATKPYHDVVVVIAVAFAVDYYKIDDNVDQYHGGAVNFCSCPNVVSHCSNSIEHFFQ